MNVFAGIQVPKILFETESPYNGNIKVWETGHTRKVIVDKTLQSLNWDSPACSKLYWGKTIEVLKENAPDMRNMLLLGLGGGTLVQLVTRNFPEAFVTSVDIDKKMVEIAYNYFGLNEVANHKSICEDALKVVVEPEEHGLQLEFFDVLFVDVYVGESYPDLGKSGNFISAIKKLTKPGGLIIFNRIYTQHHQDDVNMFINYVSGILKDVKCLVVAGYTNSDNVLIYGRNF